MEDVLAGPPGLVRPGTFTELTVDTGNVVNGTCEEIGAGTKRSTGGTEVRPFDSEREDIVIASTAGVD
jgi:hypothetical protein